MQNISHLLSACVVMIDAKYNTNRGTAAGFHARSLVEFLKLINTVTRESREPPTVETITGGRWLKVISLSNRYSQVTNATTARKNMIP